MINFVANYLNNTVMYRLMRHVLGAIACIAIAFGFFGWMSFSGFDLLVTLIVLLIVCPLVNLIFAKLFRAPVNPDSALITALILFFLVYPSTSSVATTALVGALAMASKYILVWQRRHIFNPAAAGAVIAGLFGVPIFWWVATPILLPFVAIGGWMILQKTKRGQMVRLFIVAAVASVVVLGILRGGSANELIRTALLSWPIVFFGCVMLTEPMTLPTKHRFQLIEAGLIGVIFALPYHFGPLYSSPELTLLIGNLFAFAVSHKATVRMKLVERLELAPGVLDLGFSAEGHVPFEAGQYIEWTLPHAHADARGARRTFTVASAPTEKLFRIGVRLAKEKGSSFKNALASLPIGGTIFASNIGGEFILPRDANKKLVLIAGGIGVTPFRSMAEEMIATQSKRDAILFYCAASTNDFVYQDVFASAEAFGLRTIYKAGERITADSIKTDVPDFSHRDFYLSGPGKMVDGYKALLKSLGVPHRQIHTDYFPGY